MATDLITLDEYLGLTAQSPADLDDQETARIESTITSASEAVRLFTDRNLTLADDETPGPRTYRYLGNGYLEIDDCTAINSISTAATPWASSRTLDATEWFALAEGEHPVIDSVEFYTRILATGASPEMGFKRNLDNYPYVPYPALVSVDATWGWPDIPDVVKQATVWTVETFINFKGQSPFNAEAIAGYSRSYNQFQQRGSAARILLVQALPEQAVAVLAAYSRINV